MIEMKKAIIIMKKDWKEIRTSWQIFGTMIAMPILLLIMALITFGFMFSVAKDASELMSVLFGEFSMLSIYNIIFLMIPVILPTYIAADSFVGEKIRKTIEGLLLCPISDKELIFGKILVSFVPTILITLLTDAIYAIGINILQLVFINNIVFIFPDVPFILMAIIHSPLICLITIEIMIIISLKVKGIREAQQIGGVFIIPIITFMFLPFIGLNIFDFSSITNIVFFIIVTILYIIIVIGLYYIAIKIFNRQNIIQKI